MKNLFLKNNVFIVFRIRSSVKSSVSGKLWILTFLLMEFLRLSLLKVLDSMRQFCVCDLIPEGNPQLNSSLDLCQHSLLYRLKYGAKGCMPPYLVCLVYILLLLRFLFLCTSDVEF